MYDVCRMYIIVEVIDRHTVYVVYTGVLINLTMDDKLWGPTLWTDAG